jgi:hypothetical protein
VRVTDARPNGCAHPVDVPVELVGARVGEGLHDIHLLVADDVRLPAVHVGVVAEADAEEVVVVLGRVRHRLPELVDDRLHIRVQLHAVAVLRDVAVEALVLVEVGEDGDDGLGHLEVRVALRVTREHPVRIERLDVEVIQVLRRRRTGRGEHEQGPEGQHGGDTSKPRHAASVG